MDHSLNKQYQQLRGELDTATESGGKNTLSWLIWNPASRAKRHGIVPSQGEVDTSESARMRSGAKVRPAAREVRGGLKYNPDNLEGALGDHANARLVFQELIDYLASHIKSLKRTYIKEKYKNLFEMLWAQERVYSVQINKEAVGSLQSGKQEAESKMAKDRKKIKKNQKSFARLMPGDVDIVRNIKSKKKRPSGKSSTYGRDALGTTDFGGDKQLAASANKQNKL